MTIIFGAPWYVYIIVIAIVIWLYKVLDSRFAFFAIVAALIFTRFFTIAWDDEPPRGEAARPPAAIQQER